MMHFVLQHEVEKNRVLFMCHILSHAINQWSTRTNTFLDLVKAGYEFTEVKDAEVDFYLEDKEVW